MTKRKGDFPTKFGSIEDIQLCDSLTYDQKIRETVKHHAMCLFGLACDLAEQEKRYLETLTVKEHQKKVISELTTQLSIQKEKYKRLREKIVELQSRIATAEGVN